MSSSSTPPCSSSTAMATQAPNNQQQQQLMAPVNNEYADGHLKMRLERVLDMHLEQKTTQTGTIARFSWELGALKHNILNEENTPKPYLIVYLQCTERDKRLEGWSCTAKIKITVESKSKSKSQTIEQIRFPIYQQVPEGPGFVSMQIPWEKLSSEFHLGTANGLLNITAKINVIEQIGYGTLIPLNTRLFVHGNVLLVNKYHLSTYSPYFRSFFSREWAKDGKERDEYELTDPNEDAEALQLMLAMAYPIENYPQPNDTKISEVLRLADKYDLQIVTERCEKLLIADEAQPLVLKLALAERYNLYNLRTHCLDRISPAHFCLELRDNIAVYAELSDGLKLELDERLARKSNEELQAQQAEKQRLENQQQQDRPLPPPHKRIRPRPKTPPRPNYNLPPFRFK